MAYEKDFAASTPRGHEDQGPPETFKVGSSQPQVSRGRPIRRSRAEVEAERQKLIVQVESSLDPLAAEMHLLLLRSKASTTRAAYARYSTEFQHSILDQIRSIP